MTMRQLIHRSRDERGAVFVIVIVTIVALLGMTALAVDVSSWYQVHRQVQSAADAAALAGAQGLALKESLATAQADATTYAADNIPGATVTFPTVTSPTTQMAVRVTKVAPAFFGKILGTSSATVGASATAAETSTSTVCGNPGSTCYAIFAMDSNCTSGHYGIQFSGGGNMINGGILSNGSVSPGGGGSSFGPSTYGPSASGCTWPKGSDAHTSGPTSESALITTWPIDYSTDFPPCTGAACTGPGGTPSACTQSSTSTSWTLTPVAGNIYCDVGSGAGVSAGNPATWNGAISFGACGSTSSPLVATYVAASVSITAGGCDLKSCGYSAAGYTASSCSAAAPATANYPLMYAVGTSSAAINGGGGGSYFYGDLFAPVGGITFNGGGDTTSFLEGMDVVYSGGGLIGDGPSDAGTGFPSGSSSESLTS